MPYIALDDIMPSSSAIYGMLHSGWAITNTCHVCDTGPNFLFDNVYVQFGIIILPKIALNLI